MKNGDMVIIPPGMQHHVQIHDPAVPYRRVVFWITKSFLSKLSVHSEEFLFLTGKADDSGFAWHFNEVTFNTVQRKIFHVIEEIFSDRFGRRMAVALGINDLLLFLNRTVYESLHPERYGKSEKNLDRNLIRYIEEHINEDLRLDTLSELFFVSKYHISHLFKDKMGISLHQYILKKRLAMSKDALINGRKPSEVFREYGFSDYSVFYRAFVKEFGLSPQNLIRQKNLETE
jgi:AraC-like DNA-binding protein